MEREIEEFITENQDWYVEEGKLVAGFEFTSFTAVKDAITEIMRIAGERDHHPDVTFGYSTIEVKTVTHDADNQITEKDFKLAEAISNSISKK